MSNSKKKRKLSQKIEKAQLQFDKEMTDLINNCTAYIYIPGDYRFLTAILYMKKLVENGRASSWKECADLWEEQVHRWTMERNTAEATEYARGAAQGAKAAAVFSSLNFFFR